MVEIIMVITIIGILSIGIASFFDNNERTKLYKAETCISEIDGKIKNFTNAAFTSKQIKTWTQNIFPDYYLIEFQPQNQQIVFKAKTWNNTAFIYETWSLATGCVKERVSFQFNVWTSLSGLTMNRGFRQIKPWEHHTFYLNEDGKFTGEVILDVCLADEGCWSVNPSKEFVKRIIDSRSQGIYLKRCLFYKETDRNTCETREH